MVDGNDTGLPPRSSSLVLVMAWFVRNFHTCKWCFFGAGIVVGAVSDHGLFDVTVALVRRW